MCEICHSYPCNSRCPNAPESVGVCTCKFCGEPIFVGDEYAILDGEAYHRDCLGEFSVSRWLNLLGESIQIAEVDY